MSDVPINPVERREQFTGNTTTGPFAFTFNILLNTDVAVYKNDSRLTLTADYTVAINANGTGSVTLVSTLIASDVLTIIGDRELSRTTDFITSGDLLASSLNEQLDSNVIMSQQLDEKISRGLRVNPGDLFTDLELPLKADRKGHVLAFNETSGDPEAGPEIADVSTLASINADIATLADIEDGTVATNAISGTAAISSDVTTVSGISSNVSTVAGISSDVTSVAADASDIGTVSSNIANVNTVAGINSDVTAVAGDAADIGTVATNIADINTAVDNIADIQNASTNAATATTKAAEASTSATNAATSESNAATSASTATTKAAEAATSATNAATSATNAATSASTATTKASEAATSATNAAASETSASNSATSAEASKDAALAALDNFDDRYLGQKASDPTVDNDGDALIAGALYFNTTDDVMKVYEGSTWVAAYASLSGALLTANNLSDLANATAARTNLGLGTAATTASTDYATAAQGTKVDGIEAGANNYVHPNHSGEVTSTADGATVIEDNVVDEANLKVSNTPTDGYVLTAQSGNTGGLTWAEAAAGGYASSTSAPSSPVNGDRWFESTNGILYIYIDSNWVDISTATAGGNATHTGEVTGATALTIADNVVDEANLKVSNAPTDGYFLSAQSGNTGGLTWAAAGGGGGGGSYDLISTITASGQSSFEWTSLSGYDTYYLLVTNLKSNNNDTSQISGYITVSGDGTNYSSPNGLQAGFGRTQSGNAYWNMTNNRTPAGNVITQHEATIYNSSDTTTGVSIMAKTLYRTAAQVQNNATDMTFITSAFHETASSGFVSGIQKLKFEFYSGVVSSGEFSLYGVTRS